MAIVRTDTEIFANEAALQATTVVPQSNDTVRIGTTEYAWVAGSTAPAVPGKVVIQTSETLNGRWVSASSIRTFTGTATPDSLAPSQLSEVTGTVTGVVLGDNSVVTVTNADDLPAFVTLVSAVVSADDTVTITVENNSDTAYTGVALNITVVTF